jgi:hypothetical protein
VCLIEPQDLCHWAPSVGHNEVNDTVKIFNFLWSLDLLKQTFSLCPTFTYGLLVSNAVKFGENQAFRRNIWPPSSGSKQETNTYLPPAYVNFLLHLLLDLENGSDMFLRNAGLSAKYKELQPRRPYPSIKLNLANKLYFGQKINFITA